MKITSIRSVIVHAEMRNWIFVRVETDRGPVVLASDAAHYYGNLHRRSQGREPITLGTQFYRQSDGD